MKYSRMEWGTMEAVVNKLGGLEGVERFLRDELIVSEASAKSKSVPTPTSEVVIDPIIRVDRSIRPSYPHWVRTVMHPELEPTGPTEYDISKVEQWLHNDQKGSKWVTGEKLYAYLKETDTLKTCHGLRDLEEIQKRGIAFFRKYFKGKVVFGWAGIVRDQDGYLRFPHLYESADEVVLHWCWVDSGWNSRNPALRHTSSPQA